MSNKVKLNKKRKKSNVLKNNTPISESKYGYGLYKLNENIQLPEHLGGALLLKEETIFFPNVLVQKEIMTPICSLEDCFIEVKPDTDLTNKNVLIIRNGGIGDILASLFGIVELKRKFVNINIGYLAEFKNLQFIDGFKGLIDFPAVNTIPYKKIKHFTHIVYLDTLVETRNDLNVHDLFAEAMCVNLYPATLKTLHKYFCPTKLNRNGIGIQYRSNAIIRNYDFNLVIDLINKLNKIYPDKPIYLLGVPDDYLFVNYAQVKTDANIISNGCGFESYTILKAFNVIKQLDIVISCDSSMSHIAGLCDTPLIGLFGPFHSSKRLSYYNNAIGINGKTSCSPCNRHDPQSFCPYTNGEAICTNSITPDLIVENVIKLIGDNRDI